jgi:hypothetical protein
MYVCGTFPVLCLFSVVRFFVAVRFCFFVFVSSFLFCPDSGRQIDTQRQTECLYYGDVDVDIGVDLGYWVLLHLDPLSYLESWMKSRAESSVKI